MTSLLPDDFVARCVRHFEHACEKHPKFANKIATSRDSNVYKEVLKLHRDSIAKAASTCRCSAERLMDCETCEMYEAYTKGDIPAAIEEAYDAIAVLMRTICVLEGKQELTKEVCE